MKYLKVNDGSTVFPLLILTHGKQIQDLYSIFESAGQGKLLVHTPWDLECQGLSSKGGVVSDWLWWRPAWTSQSCFLLAARAASLSSSAHGHSHLMAPQNNNEGQNTGLLIFWLHIIALGTQGGHTWTPMPCSLGPRQKAHCNYLGRCQHSLSPGC